MADLCNRAVLDKISVLKRNNTGSSTTEYTEWLILIADGSALKNQHHIFTSFKFLPKSKRQVWESFKALMDQPCVFKNLCGMGAVNQSGKKKKLRLESSFVFRYVHKVYIHVPELSVKLSVWLVQSYCRSCVEHKEGDAEERRL